MPIDVLLKKSVESLGRVGDIVRVKVLEVGRDGIHRAERDLPRRCPVAELLRANHVRPRGKSAKAVHAARVSPHDTIGARHHPLHGIEGPAPAVGASSAPRRRPELGPAHA